MLVQICSTTLRFCTSSNVQIGIWSCYWRKSLANTLLQNYNIIVPFHSKFYYPMNLHYSKTLLGLPLGLGLFYYPMNLHYSKTSKEDWSCYQCMYHKAFQMHFIISLPFCPKNILSAMLVQICSTTLRSCTSSNAQIGIWSCYWRKSLANTLLQNCEMVIEG